MAFQLIKGNVMSYIDIQNYQIAYTYLDVHLEYNIVCAIYISNWAIKWNTFILDIKVS